MAASCLWSSRRHRTNWRGPLRFRGTCHVQVAKHACPFPLRTKKAPSRREKKNVPSRPEKLHAPSRVVPSTEKQIPSCPIVKGYIYRPVLSWKKVIVLYRPVPSRNSYLPSRPVPSSQQSYSFWFRPVHSRRHFFPAKRVKTVPSRLEYYQPWKALVFPPDSLVIIELFWIVDPIRTATFQRKKTKQKKHCALTFRQALIEHARKIQGQSRTAWKITVLCHSSVPVYFAVLPDKYLVSV